MLDCSHGAEVQVLRRSALLLRDAPAAQQADYLVGQVSGSLIQNTSAASGSLSVLFGSAAPAAPLLFQPAPKVPDQKF